VEPNASGFRGVTISPLPPSIISILFPWFASRPL
jgi:hypothetical protein